MAERRDPEFLEASELPLEEWLNLLSHPPDGVLFVDYAFPSDKHRDEYIETIGQRAEEDVYQLLGHFLIPTCWIENDEWNLKGLAWDRKSDPERFEFKMRQQYYKRLVVAIDLKSNTLPWEGITWVLDLLPHSPKQALEGLRAYILAHWQHLPDGRLGGLFQAAAIIKAKFIGLPGTQSETVQFLKDLWLIRQVRTLSGVRHRF